jgi:hypothetical protein
MLQSASIWMTNLNKIIGCMTVGSYNPNIIKPFISNLKFKLWKRLIERYVLNLLKFLDKLSQMKITNYKLMDLIINRKMSVFREHNFWILNKVEQVKLNCHPSLNYYLIINKTLNYQNNQTNWIKERSYSWVDHLSSLLWSWIHYWIVWKVLLIRI